MHLCGRIPHSEAWMWYILTFSKRVEDGITCCGGHNPIRGEPRYGKRPPQKLIPTGRSSGIAPKPVSRPLNKRQLPGSAAPVAGRHSAGTGPSAGGPRGLELRRKPRAVPGIGPALHGGDYAGRRPAQERLQRADGRRQGPPAEAEGAQVRGHQAEFRQHAEPAGGQPRGCHARNSGLPGRAFQGTGGDRRIVGGQYPTGLRQLQVHGVARRSTRSSNCN